MRIHQRFVAFTQWQTAWKFISSFHAVAHLFSPHFIRCLSSAWCFHYNKLGLEPWSWHLAWTCYIVPLNILLLSWLIFLSFYLFIFYFAVRINDFWKCTGLWLLTTWALALKKMDWTFGTLCGRQKIILNQRLLAPSRADSQPWLFHWAGRGTCGTLTHLLRRHVREAEQCHQLPDKPCR